MHRATTSIASEDPTGTPLMRHSIAGMMARMRDSLALFCPNANSFRRFQANSYAPLALTWGVNNRTVSLRVPGGPAPTASYRAPHLRRRRQPLPCRRRDTGRHPPRHPRQARPGRRRSSGNGYAQATEFLPTDWLTALRALEGSAWAREAFGAEFLEGLPRDQAGRVRAVHGRGRRAGLAVVPGPRVGRASARQGFGSAEPAALNLGTSHHGPRYNAAARTDAGGERGAGGLR